jgi:DnaJ-class molecular chaperone
MILEAALGKEYSFNDKDLEEEDSDKEKEPTPQEVLGVDKNATPEEVKKSYRRLSLQYHPDKQIGKSTEEKKQATEMMTKVNEAYEKMTGKNVECEEKLSVAELEKIDKERKESKKKM